MHVSKTQIKILTNQYKTYHAIDIKISDILDYVGGNSGLTEEKIYQELLKTRKEFTVLFASTNNDTKLYNLPICEINGKELKTFEKKDGIFIVRVGVMAGNTRFLSKGKYAITDNAYILFLKDPIPYKINLKWLMLKLKITFLEYSPNSTYGAWNMTRFFENVKIDIPDIKEQNEMVEKYDKLEKLKQFVESHHNKIDNLLHNKIYNNYLKYQKKDISISEILKHSSGNSDLTSKLIYQYALFSDKKYVVLSSSTHDKTKLGHIPMCKIKNKKLKVFENKAGILIIRNGIAGKAVYLNKGKYAITDHAYILSLKDDVKYNINLKWLMYQLKTTFLEYSSKSDNGTWNMIGFFENVKIDIPDIKEQNKMVEKYDKLEKLKQITSTLKQRIDCLS